MSDLASTYALACGVPLSRPEINDAFYPLGHPLEKTILVHAFAGGIVEQNGQRIATFSAKLYDHFAEVIDLLTPIVAPLGYRFVQIGGPNEPPLKGAEYLCGRTTIAQCAYLVKRADLLIGNDSMWIHARGAAGGKIVGLYGSTDVKNHGPHWKDPLNTILIESHRGGCKPSYSSQEMPKTINWIPPEQVANAALKHLGLPESITRRSIYIGPEYLNASFDIIPNMVPNPQINIGAPAIRMDLEFNEQGLAGNLQARKCGICTDAEINLNLLAQFKPQILSMRIFVDKLSPQWIKTVRRLGIPVQAVTREHDPEKVAALRLALYDACFFDVLEEPTLEVIQRESLVYLNRKELDSTINWSSLSFRTNRFTLSSNSIHLSTAHWRAGKAMESVEKNTGEVIDTPEFWSNAFGFYLFTTTT